MMIMLIPFYFLNFMNTLYMYRVMQAGIRATISEISAIVFYYLRVAEKVCYMCDRKHSIVMLNLWFVYMAKFMVVKFGTRK